MIKLICKKKNIVLGESIFVASSFLERLKGLMCDESLGVEFDGMLIKPCNSIHTFFMNYKIDVLFLNKEYKIVKILRNMAPWRLTKIYLQANQVLEIEGGKVSLEICEGDSLEEICTN
jgi:uncharacterized membrane protein (UPF0127 family)